MPLASGIGAATVSQVMVFPAASAATSTSSTASTRRGGVAGADAAQPAVDLVIVLQGDLVG
ncbi:hypothetical protein ACIREO_22690 [Streptomyces sp. NPDC102441]|uniref:hypothetical protein n=1 Tax=Streptomyces sp. NPDC102441 TaxID=3366176 RepID=UPI00381A39B7